MTARSIIEAQLPFAYAGAEYPELGNKISGKVRDSYVKGDERVLITSDRLSAFDVILTTIPFKGQVLNDMAVFWFEETRHIIENHLLARPHPNLLVTEQLEIIPVELVVRGYLTGSAWRDYQSAGSVSGISLPGGMNQFQRFDRPLITPSTKAPSGTHDEPISDAEVIERGLAEPKIWSEACRAALALFEFGQTRAREQGLILVDTKYEFGIRKRPGQSPQVVLADEIHTSDSSRYWINDSYIAHLAHGTDPVMLDKEFFRRWLIEHGYMGNGTPPPIPDTMRVEVAERYIDAFERVTGQKFVEKPGPVAESLRTIIREFQV